MPHVTARIAQTDSNARKIHSDTNHNIKQISGIAAPSVSGKPLSFVPGILATVHL